MTAYQTLVAKIVSLLKLKLETSDRIFANTIQNLDASDLTEEELTTFIENSEYDDQDDDEWLLTLCLHKEDLKHFTAEEIQAFCGNAEYIYITAGVWVSSSLCSHIDIDTDNGICDVESPYYTWHGN